MCCKRFHEAYFSCLFQSRLGANIDEMTGNSSSGGHSGADEVSASAASLAALKIAVAGRGTALPFAKPIAIHGNTHAAASFTPFETSLAENVCQALFFSHAAH